MITFAFDVKKTVQIINRLLKRNNGALNYTKLLKLLYIADKEFLSKYDATITAIVDIVSRIRVFLLNSHKINSTALTAIHYTLTISAATT